MSESNRTDAVAVASAVTEDAISGGSGDVTSANEEIPTSGLVYFAAERQVMGDETTDRTGQDDPAQPRPQSQPQTVAATTDARLEQSEKDKTVMMMFVQVNDGGDAAGSSEKPQPTVDGTAATDDRPSSAPSPDNRTTAVTAAAGSETATAHPTAVKSITSPDPYRGRMVTRSMRRLEMRQNQRNRRKSRSRIRGRNGNGNGSKSGKQRNASAASGESIVGTDDGDCNCGNRSGDRSNRGRGHRRQSNQKIRVIGVSPTSHRGRRDDNVQRSPSGCRWHGSSKRGRSKDRTRQPRQGRH